MTVIAFGSGSYQNRSLPVSSQQMINCYLEVAPPRSKSPVAVVPSYGISSWVSAGTGVIRGGEVINGLVYVVIGTGLFHITPEGASVLLGSGILGYEDDDPVSIAGDGQNIVVASGGNAYLYNGSSLSLISDEDFPGASWIGFLDGYFPIIEPRSGRIWINETPYSPAVWNALDFKTAEGSPDDLLWGIISQREFFALGRDTIEVFYNSGDTDFPLTRTASGFIEIGIMSPGAAVKTDNGIVLLGNDGLVYRLNGYAPERISTPSIEQAVESYADKSCRAFTFVEGGHKMAALAFRTGTWVFDLSTQLWHERRSMGHSRWRPSLALNAYGRMLVGDATSNQIGILQADTFKEWGQPLRSSCTAPPVASENRKLFHGSLELEFETGVGTLETPDPQVMVDWSDDGGRTWSSEHWRTLGGTGAFRTRAVWRRMGRDQGRGRVFRYAVSDPVRRTLVQAIWQGD